MKLDDVRVATPCTLDWTKMKPTQGGRFCGDCKKVVRDLSKMTEAEARELLDAKRRQRDGEAELCVRFIYDKEGKVFFRDAQRVQENILHPANLLSRAKRAAATVALAAVPLATAACDVLEGPLGMSSSAVNKDNDETIPPDHYENMGGVSMDPNQLQPNDGRDGGADGSTEASTPIDNDGGASNTDGGDGGVSIYQ
jgi:hypothetical protein